MDGASEPAAGDGVVADVLVARGAGLSLLVAVHAISPVARAAQSNRAL